MYLQSKMVNKSKFNCLQCLKSFHSKYSLEIHTDSQHEGVVNRCKICDAPIRDIRNMTEHEQSMHGDKSFQCEKCKLIFNTKKKLRRHIRIVHDEKKFKCPYCDVKFGFQFGVNTHVKVVHGNLLSEEKKKQFNIKTCLICGHGTVNRIFERHLRTHERKSENNYSPQILQCNFCNCEFKTLKTFKEHMRKLHVNFENLNQSNTKVCGICDIVPKTKNMFQIHTHVKHLSHENFTEITKRIFKCGKCDFKTEHNNKLVSHRKTHSQIRNHVVIPSDS